MNSNSSNSSNSRTKILSYLTIGAVFVGTVLMGIAAALFPAGNTNLYLCIAGVGLILLCLRFNIFALKNDSTAQLVAENNFFILVSLVMLLRFIGLCTKMNNIVYYILLGALGVYLVIIVIMYVRNKVLGRRTY